MTLRDAGEGEAGQQRLFSAAGGACLDVDGAGPEVTGRDVAGGCQAGKGLAGVTEVVGACVGDLAADDRAGRVVQFEAEARGMSAARADMAGGDGMARVAGLGRAGRANAAGRDGS
jgi:hypothetical protein